MSAVGDTLEALARVLDGEGLPWFVFGAQAVAVLDSGRVRKRYLPGFASTHRAVQRGGRCSRNQTRVASMTSVKAGSV